MGVLSQRLIKVEQQNLSLFLVTLKVKLRFSTYKEEIGKNRMIPETLLIKDWQYCI